MVLLLLTALLWLQPSENLKSFAVSINNFLENKKLVSSEIKPAPCPQDSVPKVNPFGAGAAVDCAPTPSGPAGSLQLPTQPASSLVDYETNRQQRISKMVEGVKKADTVSATDTVFASTYCAGLKKADRESQGCSEADASRKQALTVLQNAAEHGDPEASFAYARAIVLDNTPASRQRAIKLLQDIPVKTKDAAAFLQYLQSQ